MKRKHVFLAALVAALSFLAAPSVTALPQTQVAAIQKALVMAPAAEIGAKAAELVRQAGKTDREEVALTAVREIVSKRPATVVAVVGSISKIAPEVSAAVAAEASKLAPNQALDIAKAAAANAPAQADSIAAAVAKVAPNSIASSTRDAAIVPEQSKQVVENVRANINPDATSMARSTQQSSSTNAPSGVIFNKPGTISGRPVPSIIIQLTNPTQGADASRPVVYGQP